MTFILDNPRVSRIIRVFFFSKLFKIYPQHHSTPDIKLGVLVFNGSRGSSFTSHLHAYHTQLNIFSQKEIALSAFFPTHLKYPTVSLFQTRIAISGSLLDTVGFPKPGEIGHACKKDKVSAGSADKVLALLLSAIGAMCSNRDKLPGRRFDPDISLVKTF